MREYLFVYGVFRDASNKLLGECTFCGKASVIGKLYRVDDFYPGFVEDGNNTVWGDVYLINPDVFPQLDEFEGHEYHRRKIKTSCDVECWIYQYQYNTSNFKEIEGGDWILR